MRMPLTSCFFFFLKIIPKHRWEHFHEGTTGAGVVQKKDRSYLTQFLTTRSVDDVGYAGMCTR